MLTEKNVYALFDATSKLQLFQQSQALKTCYEALYSDYKLLCKDAHTATKQNMSHLTSLADFPAFDKVKSDESQDLFVRIGKNINAMFCILFNKFYHQMHHRNRENILHSLNREVRPVISAPES